MLQIEQMNNNLKITPVKSLVNSIISMESFEELDEITEILKTKVEMYFKDVKINENRKVLDNIQYHSDGRCTNLGTLDYTVLSPWSLEDEQEGLLNDDEIFNKKILNKLNLVDNWVAVQVRIAMGQRIPTSKIVCSKNFISQLKKISKSNLPEEDIIDMLPDTFMEKIYGVYRKLQHATETYLLSKESISYLLERIKQEYTLDIEQAERSRYYEQYRDSFYSFLFGGLISYPEYFSGNNPKISLFYQEIRSNKQFHQKVVDKVKSDFDASIWEYDYGYDDNYYKNILKKVEYIMALLSAFDEVADTNPHADVYKAIGITLNK